MSEPKCPYCNDTGFVYGTIACHKCKPREPKKIILDACCGSRMFWFDKNNPLVVWQDNRKESHTLCDGRKLHICPDIIGDVCDMDFPDKTFKLVVFDPPHLTSLGKNSWMAKKYGVLQNDWSEWIRKAFTECWRV
jgi:hypothetical protein